MWLRRCAALLVDAPAALPAPPHETKAQQVVPPAAPVPAPQVVPSQGTHESKTLAQRLWGKRGTTASQLKLMRHELQVCGPDAGEKAKQTQKRGEGLLSSRVRAHCFLSLCGLVRTQAIGVLRVRAIAGEGLAAKDSNGTSDPYAVIHVGTVTARTAYVANCHALGVSFQV